MASPDGSAGRGQEQETPSAPWAAAAPSISLPKGGGAIRGMGEKFAANPVTGTGSMRVPIATSPGRSGFGPQLALSYDSGAGNGPFGFGWSLDLPRIQRKTDQGLPRYHDAEESDVFLLSGAEDLVPLLDDDGRRFADEVSAPGYTIHRYRPRIEGLFARIERWTRRDDGDVHWRSISRDNVLTLYGKDARSRIFDPEDPRRVFAWLVCETRDDKGNAVVHDYKAEDGTGVDLGRAHQRNRGDRDDPRRSANRYLKRIRYGNRVPLLSASGERPRSLTAEQIAGAGWMFEVVLDYGEHSTESPTPAETRPWEHRPDAFSSYRAGFEVRTARLCQRILMFHHFPNAPGVGSDCLVRSTDFAYSNERDPSSARNPVYTFLRAVTHSGYRRDLGRSLPPGSSGYVKRSLPAVEFDYTEPAVQETAREVAPESLVNLPVGLDGTAYQWVDLHGEGTPGILVEQAGAWLYKRNWSPLPRRRDVRQSPPHDVRQSPPRDARQSPPRDVRLGPSELVLQKPNVTVAGARAQLMDLAGDGQIDLVMLGGPTHGFFEHDEAEGWHPFRPFLSRLNRDARDPNLRFVDLDGDGRADALVTEDDAFVWHPSLGEEGFGPGLRVHHALDEEKGPRLVFADAEQSIYLADLSGDGLTDLVRIRNGEVCYWPNLGFGRFGAKVTMDNAPWLDDPDQFDQRRVRLADVDGSGTTDIVYLHREGVRLYFNQSGNGWSEAHTLPVFPHAHELASVVAVDLLGNGTACLVWSSPLPADAGRQLRYVELMGGQKPHLLVRVNNQLGAETRIEYAPSTKFYLADRLAGKPWITRLPFPVHVVERVETIDHVSGNRFVTRHAYHHGHFDGHEREFRGFGMVETWDTEEHAAFTEGGARPAASNIDVTSHVPPVLTKTWFHTGIHIGREHVSDFFAGLLGPDDRGEYWREPGQRDSEARRTLLPDTPLPAGLTPEEEREACRALKGTMLRQEIYALDGTDRAAHPYTVTEQSSTVRRVQPRAGSHHAVFLVHPRESLHAEYERHPHDPRVRHALTLEVDDWGNVRKAVAIGHGRRAASADPALTAEDRERQTRLLITFTESTFTNPVLRTEHHRAPAPVETRTFEITGVRPEDGERFRFDEWTRGDFEVFRSAAELPYEGEAGHATPEKRLVQHTRTLYRRDDLAGLLPLGALEPLALPGESYELSLTPGLLASVFKRSLAGRPAEDLLPSPSDLLTGRGADEGGYVAMDGGFWVPSGRTFFDSGEGAAPGQELSTARAHFFLPREVKDPFGHAARVEYDEYDLAVARTTDPIGNTVTAVTDYRVLAPCLVLDPNRNRTAVAFDALGLVVATAVMGKEEEQLGDLLQGFEIDPEVADVQAFVADPHGQAASLLGKATTRFLYDLDRHRRTGQPALSATLARETHHHDSEGEQTKIQIAFSFSDGFGREVQKKVQAEPGRAPRRRTPAPLPSGDVQPGDLARAPEGGLIEERTARRWVGTGRTVFNNKGKPVKQYEPFFSATHLYEPEREMTDTGVSPVFFYDPPGRAIATLYPNGTYDKVVFDPWQQTTFDVNDTAAPRGRSTGDPRTDPDIAGFVREHFAALPDTWRTWYAQRASGELGEAERDAARKTARHADTPSVAHFDALGRPFLAIAHNRHSKHDAVVDEHHATRVDLDIEGQQRSVTDALGRVVMRYRHDLRGNRLHQASMEAGERWTLLDVTGKPIRAWDSRGFARRLTYDEARRPTGLYVTEDGVERLAERTVYGESAGDQRNHRGRVHRIFDAAGVVTSEAYDFKGNLLSSRRDLLPEYSQSIDWQREPRADGGTFTGSTTYDALDRPLTATSPDGSVYRATFNEASLLERVDVTLRGAEVATPFVTGVDYDARGQRERIAYGNGARTTCEYDPLTHRLTRLCTTRPIEADAVASQLFRNSGVVQDLRYTYDPEGNLTRIEDAALQTVFHDGQQVDPVSSYTYDALYRLVEARGREHVGQSAHDPGPARGDHRDHPFFGHRAHPNDLRALRNYTERYEYDAAGNFEVLRHLAAGGSGWTRRYSYEEPSHLEPGKRSNRLTGMALGDGGDHVERFTHDAHGNVVSMPHAGAMTWDFEDQLSSVDLGGGGVAHYVYDAAGQRVRKVIESRRGVRRKERIYIGGFEVYREYGADGRTVERERQTLHVMDDKRRIALVETLTVDEGSAVESPSPVVRYQLDNHLGSASVELDQSGALISYEEYHPYGTTAFQAGRSSAEVSLKRYRYTGKERDEETGFSYHGARYYAPWLGRWTSCDPAGLGDGINLYAFVSGNPMRMTDPQGTQSFDSQEMMMGMMWNRLEQEARAIVDPVWDTAKSITDQVIQGDFYEGETTWGGVAANVAVGFVPVAGQAADARDTVAAVGNVWSKPSWKTGGMLVLAGVAWIPGVGDAAKGIFKVGKKAASGGAEVGEKLAKEGLEHLDDAERLAIEATAQASHVDDAAAKATKQAAHADDAAREAVGAETRAATTGPSAGLTAGSGDDWRTFFSVQDETSTARLLAGGEPWPTGVSKSLLGEGFYSWQSRSQAEAYMTLLEGRGIGGLSILEARIGRSEYLGLRSIDLRQLNDDALELWMDTYSLYGKGLPHGYEHVIRQTGNFGPEFFFSKDVFHLFKF